MRKRGKGRQGVGGLAANDNGGQAAAPVPEPEVLLIAAAIGRGMARDRLAEPQTANDNGS